MKNNINTLLNSLGKIREIRKADKNNGEYSSTSDNTMTVGTRMYDKRIIITQDIVNILIKNYQEDYGDFIGNIAQYWTNNHKAPSENFFKNFTYAFFDADNNEEIRLAEDFIRILRDEHRCLYLITLLVPSKVETYYYRNDSPFTTPSYTLSAGTLYTIFSPFQYDNNSDSEDYQYQEPSKEYSKGSFVDLIKNGRIEIYRIGKNDSDNLDVINYRPNKNGNYDLKNQRFSTKLNFGKDYILDSNIIIDFGCDFPFGCFNLFNKYDIYDLAYLRSGSFKIPNTPTDVLNFRKTILALNPNYLNEYVEDKNGTDGTESLIDLLKSKKIFN